jgi:hypothetical protein
VSLRLDLLQHNVLSLVPDGSALQTALLIE